MRINLVYQFDCGAESKRIQRLCWQSQSGSCLSLPSMSSTPSDRIMDLVNQAFADLDNNEVPLSNVIGKAIRIARLRGDFDNLYWLEMEQRPLGDDRARSEFIAEVADHYSRDELERQHREVVEAYIAERTDEMPVNEDATEFETKVLGLSVRGIEDKINSISTVTTTPVPPSGIDPDRLKAIHDEQMNLHLLRMQVNDPAQRILRRIEHRVHVFLSSTEKELLYGRVNADIFERNRDYVDRQLGVVSSAALEQITAAYERAQNGDDEARSHALLSCRRALKSLADALCPASDDLVTDEDGREHQLTDDKWQNRLTEFVKGKLRGSSGELMQSQLDDLARRFRGLNDAGSRGVHADVTEFELNQMVIQTYLTLGDLLRLHADESGLTMVAQGLATPV
jgi:hypothetical protein